MASKLASSVPPGAEPGTRAFGKRAWARVRSSATIKFALSGLIVVLLVGIADTFILRELAHNEAIRDARSATRLLGEGVVEAALDEGVLVGDPESLQRLDETVREHVLGDQVMRVKIWAPSGRIVYSDEERLIGDEYPLQEEDQEAFSNETAAAEISDLSQPENRFERSAEKVLEVYFPIHLPDGSPLMFETYMPYSSVAQSGNRIWLTFVAPLVGGLVFLLLVQTPMAWSMTRRMRRSQEEREELLTKAIESSNLERLRIAADLHDGVVQDLAGTSYSVRAMADRIADSVPDDVTASLRDDAAITKQAVRRLRTLLVEIYPPNLQRSGLHAALLDLVSQLESKGIHGRLDVAEDLNLPPAVEALLFRAAQESIRNVAAHSGARNVQVEVRTDEGRARLSVVDDGKGFDSADGVSPEGHFGLKLLADLARDSDGSLDIRSQPGAGTTVSLEVPL